MIDFPFTSIPSFSIVISASNDWPLDEESGSPGMKAQLVPDGKGFCLHNLPSTLFPIHPFLQHLTGQVDILLP